MRCGEDDPLSNQRAGAMTAAACCDINPADGAPRVAAGVDNSTMLRRYIKVDLVTG